MFRRLAMALAVLALACGSRLAAADRPNIVVILADDYGFGDCGINGCRDIPTPHIDSIAKEGTRCSSGYVSAPQCSPTRAGLLTGRYQQRFGHEFNAAIAESALSLKETTLADRLKAAGYATGLVGKWHLGSSEQHHPQSRGFDEFFGFLGGANPYLPRGPKETVPRILRGKVDAEEKSYLSDAFGREAVAFIDRHKSKPFFLYLAFNAPHGPLEADEARLKKFASIADPKRRTYACMVSAMDDAIGKVLAKLRDDKLDGNTLVFFFSDNGGPEDVNASRNDPLRGVKGETREGGIRVPFLVKWPGRVPAGKVYDPPVIQLDILPTALAAAGAEVKSEWKLDGVNLLPYLAGETKTAPHELLYWRFSFPPTRSENWKWAVRKGDWKLLTDIDANRRTSTAPVVDGNRILVNLADDLEEKKDLSKEHPEKVKELEAAWKKWNAELPEPVRVRANKK